MDRGDLNNYLQLKAVIKSGKFEMKGDAITKVASLLTWFDLFELKIKESMRRPGDGEIKPIEGQDVD